MAIRPIQAQVSVTLDRRRAKKDGTYPVKLYVWDIVNKTGKHYSTGISATSEDFHSAWETTKTRKEFKDLRSSIVNAQAIAERTIDGLSPFSFDAFERKGAIPKGQQSNVFWYYRQKINELNEQGRIGTASNYECSMNSLKAFANSDSLLFSAITPKWLQFYEDDMVANGKSLTTVGVYLRPLRAIFNDAIADNSNPLTSEHYPFGKRKYIIPAGMKSKSPLSKAELHKFLTADIESEAQKKARDFFFFSFACNGMNMKDIAQLRFDNLTHESFSFVRAKTKKSKKARQKPVTVMLNDFSREVIAKYGNEQGGSIFVFPILNEKMTALEQHQAVQSFTRSVNQGIKRICTSIGIANVSTYTARHSFASIAVNSGRSLEFVQEAFAHADKRTTQGYFAGFNDDMKKEFSASIMNFK